MPNSLYQNLSKNQKIGIFVVLQIFLIVVIAVSVNSVLNAEKPHIKITNDNEIQNVPEDDVELFKKQLWEVVSENVEGADESVIDDATIREGTYKENKDEDGYHGAEFLIDIDSIKQTYAISITWSKTNEVADSVYIGCPPQNEMKYPETTCKSMYNDTYSLDLYLPYSESTPYDEEAKDIFIDGDEYSHIIYVQIVACGEQQTILKNKADEYLKSIPTDLSEYTIDYNITSLDANCGVNS